MSLNAGFVDTAGFLALQGLFTAHVTGNFVTFGAAMVLGTSGALAKLLALPVFCLVVIGTRVFSFLLPAVGLPIFSLDARAKGAAVGYRRGLRRSVRTVRPRR
ncbi:DUF1275 family protein [Bradyrhizobium sp. USDA 329]|uniref:DUF1275 family protein n=1 Tax=Bradyrhizobium sp. USDA 329 TaxID=3156310 RepID=UPI00351543EF